VPNTYTTQSVTYPAVNGKFVPPVTGYPQPEAGDKQRSTMELTLEKIDEQLQMSRKMFPS